MKNINESGRSMVEMLGVLAIIGVLSIGGIAGYTMAMNKYQANEIVNAIVQGAVECRTRKSISDDVKDGVRGLSALTCANWAKGSVQYQLDSNDAVAVQVCKALKSSLWTGATGGTAFTACDTDTAAKTTSTARYYIPAS